MIQFLATTEKLSFAEGEGRVAPCSRHVDYESTSAARSDGSDQSVIQESIDGDDSSSECLSQSWVDLGLYLL